MNMSEAVAAFVKSGFSENRDTCLSAGISDSSSPDKCSDVIYIRVCLCHWAKGNRKIEVNHNLNHHKEKARKRLTCEEGLFGQTKSNKGYNRFRLFDRERPEKEMMDFAIFAIAFNVLKLYRKNKNAGDIPPNRSNLLPSCIFFYLRQQKSTISPVLSQTRLVPHKWKTKKLNPF